MIIIVHVLFLDMSSKYGIVPVKMVRIQSTDKKQPITYPNNVTVGLLKDTETDIVYLRISVNQKMILSEELDHFQWLEQCSSDTVATIDSPAAKIIMIYNAEEQRSREIFTQMKLLLQQSSPDDLPIPSPTRRNPVPEDRTQEAIDDLLKFIETGSSDNAERAARYLAQSSANVQFNLGGSDKPVSRPANTATASSNILRLKLQIECHLQTDPKLVTIYVRSGTTLRELKDQIESTTGLKYKDQYWYAFDRYLIDDDYQFGSSQPVVPPVPRNALRTQTQRPADPIRSGDTLILYVAQIRPYN